MRHPLPTLLFTSLALGTTLTGCAASAERDADQGSAPAGVVEQYAALTGEVTERGGSTTSGEWEVAYIVEPAEPWYAGHGAHQSFRSPTDAETHHIEIVPREAGTGRIVPDVPITLEVVDDSGAVVDSQRLNFYYSTFFHYANNFSVPESGRYTLRAELGVPTFLRHGAEDEQPPLSQGVTVSFDDVDLTRG